MGGAEDHMEAPKETARWGVVIPFDIGVAKESGDQGVLFLHQTEVEHSGTVHFRPTHHVSLPGSGETPGEEGCKTVVGAGQPAASGSAGGGSGMGIHRWRDWWSSRGQKIIWDGGDEKKRRRG